MKTNVLKVILPALVSLVMVESANAGLFSKSKVEAPQVAQQEQVGEDQNSTPQQEEKIENDKAAPGATLCKSKKYQGVGATPAEAALNIKQRCHSAKAFGTIRCAFMRYRCFDSQGNDVTRDAKQSLRK